MKKINCYPAPCTVAVMLVQVGEGRRGWGGQGLRPPMVGSAWPGSDLSWDRLCPLLTSCVMDCKYVLGRLLLR